MKTAAASQWLLPRAILDLEPLSSQGTAAESPEGSGQRKSQWLSIGLLLGYRPVEKRPHAAIVRSIQLDTFGLNCVIADTSKNHRHVARIKKPGVTLKDRFHLWLEEDPFKKSYTDASHLPMPKGVTWPDMGWLPGGASTANPVFNLHAQRNDRR